MFNGFKNRLEKEMFDMVDKSILVDGYLREYYLKWNKKALYNDIVVVPLFHNYQLLRING